VGLGGGALLDEAGRLREPPVKNTHAQGPIPIILCIDVEPDPFLVNRSNPEPWAGYEQTFAYLHDMRGRFEDATGSPVHYTWCFRMDPQVADSYGSPTWAVDRFPAFAEEIRRQNDETGIHPHAYRWAHDKQRWIEDLGNQDWVDHCVESSLDAYETAFGRRCETFRFGNFWINSETINLLERRQVRYDLTVEPGLPADFSGTLEKGFSTGSRPDLTRVPRVPYQPCQDDLCKPAPPGSRNITVIPLTSGSLQVGARLWSRAARLWRNGWRHRLQSVPLSMWKRWDPPNTFDRMIDRAIAAQSAPYLAFAIRSSVGIGRSFKAVDNCLQVVLSQAQRRRFVFSTPAEALVLLAETSAARR
jgi:hypothetical protein